MANNSVISIVIRAKDEASQVIGGFTQRLGGVKTAVAGVVAGMAAFAAGRGIANFFGIAIDSAKEFERQLDVNRSILTGTPESIDAAMEMVKAAAEEMGATTKFTATEAAAGLEELLRAGMNAEEAVATLPSVLNTAAGAGISLADSAARLTDVAANLGLGTDEISRAADVLATGAATSATNVQQLSDALALSGDAATKSGLSLEETAATLGIMANSGFRAAEAGTGLRNLLTEINNPLSTFQKELARAGVSVDNLDEAIEFLGSGTAEAQSAMFTLTQEAQRTAGILVREGEGGVREYAERLSNVEGAAARAAETMSDNLVGALQGLGSAWDAVQRFLVEPLLEPITKQVKDLANALTDTVKNGALNDFRQAILETFQNGAQHVREFVSEFDFEEALKKVGAFARSASENLAGLASASKKAAALVSATWNGALITLNAVGAGIVSLASYYFEAAAAIERLGAKIGISTQATADRLQEKADQLAETATDLAGKSVEAYNRTREALDDLTDSGDQAADRQDQAAKTIKKAQEDVQESVGMTIEQFDKYIQEQDAAALASEQAAARQSEAARAAEEAQGAAIESTRRKIHELRDEYARLIEAGDTQQAAQTLRELNAALEDSAVKGRAAAESLGNMRRSAEDAGSALDKAFKTLQITSQASLEAAAAKALEAFRTIKTSGLATTADIRQAFLSYAQTALEAVENVSEQQKQAADVLLETEATVLGIGDAYRELAGTAKQANEAIEETGKKLQDTGDKSEEAFGDANEAVSNYGNEVEEAGEKVEFIAAAVARFGAAQETAFGSGGIARYDRLVQTILDSVQEARDIMEEIGEMDLADPDDVIRFEEIARVAQRLADRLLESRSHMDDVVHSAGKALVAAIDAAQDRISRFRDELAETAKDILGDIQDRIDRLQGNEAAIAKRRHEDELARLEDLLWQAQQARDLDAAAKLREAIKLLRKEYELILKDLGEAAPGSAEGVGIPDLEGNAIQDMREKTKENRRKDMDDRPERERRHIDRTIRFESPIGGPPAILSGSDDDVDRFLQIIESAGGRTLN